MLLGWENNFIKAPMKWFPLKAPVGREQLHLLDEPPNLDLQASTNNGNDPGRHASSLGPTQDRSAALPQARIHRAKLSG